MSKKTPKIARTLFVVMNIMALVASCAPAATPVPTAVPAAAVAPTAVPPTKVPEATATKPPEATATEAPPAATAVPPTATAPPLGYSLLINLY